MKGIRKIITNQTEITMAQQYNTVCRADYAGSGMPPPVSPVPEPKYDTQEFSFKLENVASFYVQRDTVRGKSKGDLIANIIYEGEVIFQYDPLLEARLEMYLNVK
jgi:hypothetical protein